MRETFGLDPEPNLINILVVEQEQTRKVSSVSQASAQVPVDLDCVGGGKNHPKVV